MNPPWVDTLATAYEAAPVFRASDWHAWRQLATEHVRLADIVRRRVSVVTTSEAEPYPDAAAMARDVASGHFVVSSANSEHPAWSARENVAFRIVHDVLGHCASVWAWGALVPPCRIPPFTLDGERRACRHHAGHVSRDLWPALLTECLGQVARQHVLGRFDVQKVATLDVAPEVYLAA